MNQLGSIFFERLVTMRENNNNNFVMTRDYRNRLYPYIHQLRITRIKMIRNYKILFRQWLENQISHITNDYDFSWGPEDTRSRRPVDTVGYLVCRYNNDNFDCLKELDGASFGDKFLACKPNAFCDYARNPSFIINSSLQRYMVIQFNEIYDDLDINRLDMARPMVVVPVRRTLGEYLRHENMERNRIVEQQREEQRQNLISQDLHRRLNFNNKQTTASNTENEEVEIIDNVIPPERVSNKRKSSQLDDAPNSKTRLLTAESNDGVVYVPSFQDCIDVAHGIIKELVTNVVVIAEKHKALAQEARNQAEIKRLQSLQLVPFNQPSNNSERNARIVKLVETITTATQTEKTRVPLTKSISF